MRELDKTKVYSLEDLTGEELKELWIYLVKTDEDWITCPYEEVIEQHKTDVLIFNKHNWEWCNISKPTTNAKELFYTLENVQVDCSSVELNRISRMIDIFLKNGYKIWQQEKALVINDKDDFFLTLAPDKELFLNYTNDKKHTITYEKFMELFGEYVEIEIKTDSAKKWEELHDWSKEFIKGIVRPQHYSKGIDTFERMEANCTKEECLAFAKGNIDKYNFRTKGQDLEDYKKIISYAQWAIKLLEK